MPIRRYYVTRRYSRRNTTPDAHCNQLGVGMRDPLICVRVLRTRVSARTAYVRTYVRRCIDAAPVLAPMQPDTGQRLCTHTRTRSCPVAFRFRGIYATCAFDQCVRKQTLRPVPNSIPNHDYAREKIIAKRGSFHLYAVEGRRARCETFLWVYFQYNRDLKCYSQCFSKVVTLRV